MPNFICTARRWSKGRQNGTCGQEGNNQNVSNHEQEPFDPNDDSCPGSENRERADEWTWDGNDEMDPAQGRGWAVVQGDELHGMIFFHGGGDDSEFVAERAKQKKATKPK